MTSESSARRFSASCALACLLAAKTALGQEEKEEEKGEWSIDPVDVQVATSSSKIKGEVAYDTAPKSFNGCRLGLALKIPASEGEAGAPEARLDEWSSGWRIGPSFAMSFRGEHSRSRVQLETEWGPRQYKFFPLPALAEESAVRHSIAATINAWHEDHRDYSPIRAIQLRARIANEYEESKEVGIVTPAADGLPARITEQKIVESPKAEPVLTVRAFFYSQLGAKGSATLWGIGPSIVYSTQGEKGGSFTLGDRHIIRPELWLYHHPLSKPANIRIGVGAFASFYAKGESEDNRRVVPGVLFQVRFGAPIFTY